MNIYMLLSFQSKNFSTHEHLSNVYSFIVYLYNYIMITLHNDHVTKKVGAQDRDSAGMLEHKNIVRVFEC